MFKIIILFVSAKFLLTPAKFLFIRASPEAIKIQLVTHQSDVWSFGVTLWEIFSHGTTPWKGLNGLEVSGGVWRVQFVAQPGGYM